MQRAGRPVHDGQRPHRGVRARSRRGARTPGRGRCVPNREDAGDERRVPALRLEGRPSAAVALARWDDSRGTRVAPGHLRLVGGRIRVLRVGRRLPSIRVGLGAGGARRRRSRVAVGRRATDTGACRLRPWGHRARGLVSRRGEPVRRPRRRRERMGVDRERAPAIPVRRGGRPGGSEVERPAGRPRRLFHPRRGRDPLLLPARVAPGRRRPLRRLPARRRPGCFPRL